MRSFTLLLLATFCFLLPVNRSSAQTILKQTTPFTDENRFAAPPENIPRLFYMQRTSNSNTLIYELNITNGHLDEENPIHPYWIRYNEKGQREDLNYIQRKFAYGVTTKKLANDQFDVRFVSYKKFPLLLMKANDGKYHIFATVSHQQIMLNRVFVKIEGGSFWLPNIVYVELRGTDPTTGREIIERFKP